MDEFFAMMDRVNRLAAMRKAVGPYPHRLELIRASAGKDLSETMTLMLALIVFDGYELFPARK